MKLKELLEKITALPWLKVECDDGDQWIGTDGGDDRIATLDGNTVREDKDYLVHAANNLPTLAAAVRNFMNSTAEYHKYNATNAPASMSPQWTAMWEALEKSENVKL